MNKQDLLAKIAAMKAPGAIPQAQATTPAKIAPQAPAAAPLPTLQSLSILWHEGTGSQDGKHFSTWTAARQALKIIYDEGNHEGGGYYKVKICIKWTSGAEITDRIDTGNHPSDYNPHRQTIGEFLSPNKSVMYSSNLQIGDRATLSWEDPTEPTPAAAEAPELSTVTFADLMNSNHPEGAKLDVILAMPTATAPTATAPANVATNSPAAPAEATTAREITLAIYSPKSFAVRGAGTVAIKDKLLANGGKYNRYLKNGAGWIFSNKRLAAVQMIIKK